MEARLGAALHGGICIANFFDSGLLLASLARRLHGLAADGRLTVVATRVTLVSSHGQNHQVYFSGL